MTFDCKCLDSQMSSLRNVDELLDALFLSLHAGPCRNSRVLTHGLGRNTLTMSSIFEHVISLIS